MHLKRLLARRDFLVVLVLLALTLPFFLIGIGWGLPNNQFGDEWAVLNSTLMLPFRKGDPRLYFYGVPYMYLYAALIGFLFVVSMVLGWVASIQDFTVAFLRDPSAFVLAGRLLSVTFAAGTVVVTFVLARRFLSPLWAVVAVLAFALAGNFVAYAHFAKLDQMLIFLYVLTTWLLMSGQDSKPRWVAAMLLSGVALATKLSAIALVIPIFVTVVLDCGGLGLAWKDKRFWLAPTLWFAGFALVNPWAIIRFAQFLGGAPFAESPFGFLDGGLSTDSFKKTPTDNLLYYGYLLFKEHGALVLLMVVLSPALLWLGRTRDRVVLLASGWALVPFVLVSPRNDVHWLLPATPLLVVAGFALLDQASVRLGRWKNVALLVVGLATLAPQVVGRAAQVRD